MAVVGGSSAAQAAGPVADYSPAVSVAPKGREVAALATARSRTWIAEDGSHTTRVFARAVNVREGGVWRPIDNTLRADGVGGFEATRGGLDLTLPGTLDRPVRIVDGDAWLELSMRASAARASISGPTATYAAGDGVTAKLSADNAAVKEDLLLASADAQNAFTYDLRLSDGLRPKGRTDGGIEILDAKGEVVFSAPAPVAADADGVPAPDASMSQTVRADGDGWVVSLSLDRGWLREPGRSFPVLLDPSFTIPGGPARDCSLRSTFASTSQCTSTVVYGGRVSSTNLNNGLFAFNLVGQVPQAAFIASAKLRLNPTLITSPGAVKTLAARDVTADWDNAATWNNRTASAAWTTAGGDLGASDESTIPFPASAVQSVFTVTDLAERWVAKPATNRGVAITDNGSTVNGSLGYASSESATSANWPSLEITYWPRTGQSGNYTIDSQQLTDRQSLGVNVASGNLMLTASELQVGSTTLPLDVTRFYNSGEEWEGQVGQGGRLSIGRDIVLYECDDAGSRCLVGPNGYRARFKKTSTGTYTTPNNIGNVTLTKLTTGALNFELKDNRSGTVMEFFDASYAYLRAIRDKNGVSRISFTNAGTAGSLSKITDAHSRDYDVTSDAAGRTKTIEIPASLSPTGTAWKWSYDYNAFGFLTKATDPDGRYTSYDYNAANKLSKITDPRGNDTLITYDTANRVTSVTRKVDGTTTNDVTTTYAYPAIDSDCNVGSTGVPDTVVGKTTVTDPNGNTAKYCWDQFGAVVVARDGENRPTSTTYTPEGNGDKFDSFTGTASPYASTAYTWGSGTATGKNLTMIESPEKEKFEISYGTVGGTDLFKDAQPETSTDEQGDVTRITYENPGDRLNVSKIVNERTVGSTTTKTLSATLAWDPLNKSRLASSMDKALHTTTYTYSTASAGVIGGDLIAVTPHNSTIIGPTQFTYNNKISRVSRSKDGRTAPWVDYTYDKVGRQLTTPDSDGLTQTVTYDDNGNVLTRSVPSASQYSSYVYDKLNRRTSETLNGATTTYTYDKAGNLKTLTDASGTVTYTYTTANRLKTVTAPQATGSGTDTTTYTYADPGPTNGYRGSVTAQLVASGGGTIKQSFDKSGKPVEVLVTNASAAQTYKQTWDYATDRAADGTINDPGTLVYATTTQNGGTGATTSGRLYSYTLGQLTSQIDFTGGTATDETKFTYDPAGNRTSRVKAPWPPGSPASSTKTYAYNENNQLCWTLNAASSATCTGAAPGTGVPAGATTFTYDAAGNQTGYTGGPSTTWDAKGRIDLLGTGYSSILSPNNNELVGLGSDTYTNTVLGVSRITTGGTTAKLVREPGGASVVSQVKGSDKSWFVADQIGSTTALIASNGTVQRSYAYDVDGNDTPTGSGPTTNIKFAGGHDVGNGLYHFGARYYQPSTGRWTQMDPLLQPSDLGQANRYTYVANDPINATDPSGLIAQCVRQGPAGTKRRGNGTLPDCPDPNDVSPDKREQTKKAVCRAAGLGGILGAPFSGGASLAISVGSYVPCNY